MNKDLAVCIVFTVTGIIGIFGCAKHNAILKCQRNAIKEGVAVWENDNNGKPVFTFITKPKDKE